MSITIYQSKVYSICKKIPKGKVSTYGIIANALKSSPRAVGQALRCNPFAPSVPCHRVVKSDGSLGGFMGAVEGKEIQKKKRLLKQEGITITENKINDFSEVLIKL